MPRKPSLAINTLTNFLRYAVEMVVMFFITAKTVRVVGIDDFGLWSLVFSVVGFFSLLDFGLMTGTVKYVSECRGSGDVSRRNQIVSSLFFVYLFLALTALAGLLILSLFFNALFSIPEEQRSKVIWLFWIIAFRAVVLNLPLGLFMGILFGEQRIARINTIKSACTGLYGITGWYVLVEGYGITGLAWTNLAAMIAEHVLYVYFSYRSLSGLRISWRLADRSIFKEITSFSLYQFIVNISVLVMTRSDPLVIKFFLPLSAVATYSVALKITENIRLLVKQSINALTPVIGELHGAGNVDKIRKILLYATKYSFAMAVFICVPVALSGKPLIEVWVGEGLLEAYPVLCILCAVTALTIPQLVASNILVMTNHYRYTAWASMLSIAINLAVTITLIQIWGLVGVALGTLAATVCVDVFVVVQKACRELNVSYRRYFQIAILPSLIPAILHAAVQGTILWLYQPAGFIMLAAINVPGAIVFGLTFYGISFDREERIKALASIPFLNRFFILHKTKA